MDPSDRTLSPFSPQIDLLQAAYQQEVAHNPLPASVKRRALERALGSRAAVERLFSLLGDDHLGPVDDGQTSTVRESISLDFAERHALDAQAAELLRQAQGAEFPAWAQLLGFAAHASWTLASREAMA